MTAASSRTTLQTAATEVKTAIFSNLGNSDRRNLGSCADRILQSQLYIGFDPDPTAPYCRLYGKGRAVPPDAPFNTLTIHRAREGWKSCDPCCSNSAQTGELVLTPEMKKVLNRSIETGTLKQVFFDCGGSRFDVPKTSWVVSRMPDESVGAWRYRCGSECDVNHIVVQTASESEGDIDRQDRRDRALQLVKGVISDTRSADRCTLVIPPAPGALTVTDAQLAGTKQEVVDRLSTEITYESEDIMSCAEQRALKAHIDSHLDLKSSEWLLDKQAAFGLAAYLQSGI